MAAGLSRPQVLRLLAALPLRSGRRFERVVGWWRIGPQRLKPLSRRNCYGTAKAVPLNEAIFALKQNNLCPVSRRSMPISEVILQASEAVLCK